VKTLRNAEKKKENCEFAITNVTRVLRATLNRYNNKSTVATLLVLIEAEEEELRDLKEHAIDSNIEIKTFSKHYNNSDSDSVDSFISIYSDNSLMNIISSDSDSVLAL
jgi:hypothetical protein